MVFGWLEALLCELVFRESDDEALRGFELVTTLAAIRLDEVMRIDHNINLVETLGFRDTFIVKVHPFIIIILTSGLLQLLQTSIDTLEGIFITKVTSSIVDIDSDIERTGDVEMDAVAINLRHEDVFLVIRMLHCDAVVTMAFSYREVEKLRCDLRRFVVTIDFLDESLEHIKVELIELRGNFKDFIQASLIDEVFVAVLDDSRFIDTIITDAVEDTTRAVNHVGVDSIFIIRCEDEELLGREGAVEKGEKLFLLAFLLEIDLLKLVEDDESGLGDFLDEGLEIILNKGRIDDDGRHALLSELKADNLALNGLAGALFTDEENAGLGGTGVEGVDDSVRIEIHIAVHLGGDFEALDSGKIKLSRLRIALDDVIRCGELIEHLERRVGREGEVRSLLDEEGLHGIV